MRYALLKHMRARVQNMPIPEKFQKILVAIEEFNPLNSFDYPKNT